MNELHFQKYNFFNFLHDYEYAILSVYLVAVVELFQCFISSISRLDVLAKGSFYWFFAIAPSVRNRGPRVKGGVDLAARGYALRIAALVLLLCPRQA